MCKEPGAIRPVMKSTDPIDEVSCADAERDRPRPSLRRLACARSQQRSPVTVPRGFDAFVAQQTYCLVPKGRLGPDPCLRSDEDKGANPGRSEIREFQRAGAAHRVP